jgi:hypothetical protein
MFPKEETFVLLSCVNSLHSLLKLYYCSDGPVAAKPAPSRLALRDFLLLHLLDTSSTTIIPIDVAV